MKWLRSQARRGELVMRGELLQVRVEGEEDLCLGL